MNPDPYGSARPAKNQTIYIPVGAQHRIESPGRIPMVFIEVQTGHYVVGKMASSVVRTTMHWHDDGHKV